LGIPFLAASIGSSHQSTGVTVTPEEVAAANAHAGVSLSAPVYLRAGAVICPQMDVLGAYLDGRQAGGEDEGHRAVQRLFLRADGECIRTINRDRVRVLDNSVAGDRLVKIQWEGMTNLAFTRDLSN
jgi:hypothetical protein